MRSVGDQVVSETDLQAPSSAPASGTGTLHRDAHEAFDGDDDADAGRVGGAVAGLANTVAAVRLFDAFGIVHDMRRPFEGQPAASVDLAECATPGGADVAELHAVSPADRPGEQSHRVVGEPDPDDGPDSDIDLLVVMPIIGRRHDTSIGVLNELRDLPVPVDINAVDPAHLDEDASVPGVVRVAMREGRVLVAA